MVQSAATTVEAYLDALPDERRAELAKARALVKKYLPEGYREGMLYGMIGWAIPLEQFPNTYNKQPLCTVGLAAQKNHLALYLMCAYTDPNDDASLREAYEAAGKKLDMGTSCIRFKRYDELLPEAIGRVIAAMPPERLIAAHDAVHRKR